jgi:hypothetical protein
MEKPELLVEGSYSYSESGMFYSQENFKLLSYSETQLLQLKAEVLARTDMGEFLKMLVTMDMNPNLYPVGMTIERSLGKRYSFESYKVDMTKLELNYLFRNSESEQEFKRPFNTKTFLTSASIAGAGFFSLNKKWDVTGRTSIILVNSPNEWSYVGPPSDKTVWAEIKSGENPKFTISGQEVNALHVCLFEHESNSKVQEDPANFYLSKHYGIPYQVVDGNRKIVMTKFKDYNLK